MASIVATWSILFLVFAGYAIQGNGQNEPRLRRHQGHFLESSGSGNLQPDEYGGELRPMPLPPPEDDEENWPMPRPGSRPNYQGRRPSESEIAGRNPSHRRPRPSENGIKRPYQPSRRPRPSESEIAARNPSHRRPRPSDSEIAARNPARRRGSGRSRFGSGASRPDRPPPYIGTGRSLGRPDRPPPYTGSGRSLGRSHRTPSYYGRTKRSSAVRIPRR